MSKKFKVSNTQNLVSIIADEDCVTGLLLTGVGERNMKGETNFLIVDHETQAKTIEDTFKRFLKSPTICVILVNQVIAEKYLRHLIQDHDEIIPTVLEIPSKDSAYDSKKVINHTIMQRAHRLLYGREID